MPLTLYAAGLNHTTASVAVREEALASFCHAAPDTLVENQPDRTLFPEFLVLSTCNRTEIYAVAADTEQAARALKACLRQNGSPEPQPRDPVYLYSGRRAVTHLFAVAAGLDSLVLGEFEILGQVRRAYQTASARGTVGPLLHQLLTTALRLGKRARAETEIGSGALSVATTALALARQQLGTLNGRNVLVIGTGEMGRRTVEHLRGETGCTVWIANRTFSHAQELAQSVRGHAIPFEEVPAALAQADLVVTATNAPHYILNASLVARARAAASHSLCLLDLAMPRNIDPCTAQLPNVRLFNLDDLTALVANTRAQRAQAVQAVQAMIEAEADAFETWQEERTAAPLIAGLYARGKAVQEIELDKALRRLQHLSLTERDREIIAALAAGVVNKMLATPATQLKARTVQENSQVYLDVVRDLFDLHDERF